MTTKLATAARIILGLVLTIFGLNGFFGFLPMPPVSPAAATFMGAIVGTGYLMYLVMIVEVSVGLLLLINRYVPMALILLAPISVNIIAFHLFLDISGIIPAVLVTILNVYLLVAYRAHYYGLIRSSAGPSNDTGSEVKHAHA